jgi:hypothetical protein
LVPLITIVGFFTVIIFSMVCYFGLLGSLFPLPEYVYPLYCWSPACTASLSCYFLSIHFLHLIKKKTIANQTENPHPNMTKKRNKLGEHPKQPKAATCSK